LMETADLSALEPAVVLCGRHQDDVVEVQL